MEEDGGLTRWERTMLELVEAGLERDDPVFVQRFTDRSRSLGAGAHPSSPRDVIARWLRRRHDEA
ncbi:MAG: hypothetical protein FWJ94_06005 [Acidimicrobiia bacterium]